MGRNTGRTWSGLLQGILRSRFVDNFKPGVFPVEKYKHGKSRKTHDCTSKVSTMYYNIIMCTRGKYYLYTVVMITHNNIMFVGICTEWVASTHVYLAVHARLFEPTSCSRMKIGRKKKHITIAKMCFAMTTSVYRIAYRFWCASRIVWSGCTSRSEYNIQW